MDNSAKLMTVSDLREFLQVSVPQIYLMINRGMPYLTTGKHKRFVAQDVIGWMREQAVGKETGKQSCEQNHGAG